MDLRKIIDKYVVGEDKDKHLYTHVNYERLGINKGDVQITVKNYFKDKKYAPVDDVYYLKKIDNKWLIYSFGSVADD